MAKNSSPPNTERIFLTGFMGSGKSAVGRILARLKDQRDGHSLLEGDEPLEGRISSLLEARGRVYSCAQWILVMDELTPKQAAELIFQRLREKFHAQVH